MWRLLDACLLVSQTGLVVAIACVWLQMANYWEPAKKLLNDPTKFLDSLFSYDRDNISDAVIKRVEPYIQVIRAIAVALRIAQL